METGSDELLGEEGVTSERARLELEIAARQAEELKVTEEPPSEDETGEQHEEEVPPPGEDHPEFDPTPPADDDYPTGEAP